MSRPTIIGRTIAALAIVVAVNVPTITNAAQAVSITAITTRMGDTRVTFSNGITCTDNDGSPKIGAVQSFYSGWWAYWYTQNGVESDCA